MFKQNKHIDNTMKNAAVAAPSKNFFPKEEEEEEKADFQDEFKDEFEDDEDEDEDEDEDDEEDISEHLVDRWEDMDLKEDILAGIHKLGFEAPRNCQRLTKWIVNTSKHIVIDSETGTGKTFAFGIPALQCVDRAVRSAQVVILVHSKDLINQIYDNICELAKETDITIARHMGTSFKNEHGRMVKGSGEEAYVSREVRKNGKLLKVNPGTEQIVIGTPARLVHLFDPSIGPIIVDFYDKKCRKQNKIEMKASLKYVHQVIIDECDRLIPTSNFDRDAVSESVERLVGEFTANEFVPGLFSCARQMWFSATASTNTILANKAKKLGATFIKMDSTEVQTQIYHRYVCLESESQKIDVVKDILENFKLSGCIFIFCSSAQIVMKVYNKLYESGFAVVMSHGFMKIEDKNRNIEKFRANEAKIMVTTDNLARGIDVQHARMVIHYDLPINQTGAIEHSVYIHRSGRCGRDFKVGVSIALVIVPDAKNNAVPQSILFISESENVNITYLEKNFFQNIRRT